MMRFKGFQRLVVSVFLSGLGLVSTASHLNAQNYLVMSSDFWAYWEFGFEPDPNWMSADYEDYEWAFGPSPLGFGEPYLTTPLQPGITTAYFRTYFFIDAVPTRPVTLRVRRDDGVI